MTTAPASRRGFFVKTRIHYIGAKLKKYFFEKNIQLQVLQVLHSSVTVCE